MSLVENRMDFRTSGSGVVSAVAELPKSDKAPKLQYTFIVRLFGMSTILPEISWLIANMQLIFKKISDFINNKINKRVKKMTG